MCKWASWLFSALLLGSSLCWPLRSGDMLRLLRDEVCSRHLATAKKKKKTAFSVDLWSIRAAVCIMTQRSSGAQFVNTQSSTSIIYFIFLTAAVCPTSVFMLKVKSQRSFTEYVMSCLPQTTSQTISAWRYYCVMIKLGHWHLENIFCEPWLNLQCTQSLILSVVLSPKG